MEKGLRTKRLRILAVFSTALFLSGCDPSRMTMVSKNYPGGFALRHPRTWTARVMENKYIWIGEPEGEGKPFLLVYPFWLERAGDSRAWLQKNIPALKDFFSGVKMEKVEQVRTLPDEAAGGFLFQKGDVSYRGIALCSILERSGIVYVMAAPQESFEASRAQLLSILESFRFTEPEPEQARAAAKPKVSFQAFQDPVEQAFSIDVPKGWEANGGTYRRASVDIVHVLQAESPDRRIRMQFNDQNLPLFAIPNQTLLWAGFGEGSWYSPGYGVMMLVKSYLPGPHFLKEYLQRHYSPHLTNFQTVSQKERPDIVRNFNQIYGQFASSGVSFTLHAGDAAFRFEKDSEPYVGYGLAVTQIVQSPAMEGGNWSVALLLITTCPEQEVDTVRGIVDHMFQSIRMNPSWVAAQQQLAGNVSQIVTRTGQEISRIINESYWTRQAVLDDAGRKFSNVLMGMTDVVDPTTGAAWKVEAGHNYYWAKGSSGGVVGTETAARPDIDFTLLKEF